MSGSRAGRWRYYHAYVYVPKFRLFEVGEALGVLEEVPSLQVLDSLPVSPSPDGSVLISPRNARHMVARSDYANYRNCVPGGGNATAGRSQHRRAYLSALRNDDGMRQPDRVVVPVRGLPQRESRERRLQRSFQPP